MESLNGTETPHSEDDHGEMLSGNSSSSEDSFEILLDDMIEKGKSTHKLILSKLNLDEIPSQVFDAAFLTELDVSSNRITKIPPEIMKLTLLNKLDISDNALMDLPKELGCLKNLKDLRLSCNPIPRELKVDHFNGVLIEKLKRAYEAEKKDQKPKENLRTTLARRFSLGGNNGEELNPGRPKRSLTLGKILFNSKTSLPTSNEIETPKQKPKPVFTRSKTVSSFGFNPKPVKTKYSKEIRDKKKTWIRLLGGFIQIGDEMRSRSKLNVLSENGGNNSPSLSSKAPRESSPFNNPNRTFRGSYYNNSCAIRIVFLMKDEKSQFYEQICAASDISHQNVNKLIGMIKYNKKFVKIRKDIPIPMGVHPVLVISDLMLQGSLCEWLASYAEGITLKKKLIIAKQVAQGMLRLHSCKPMIIHHNLKSSNVVFAENWQAKVTDYFLGNRFLKEYSHWITRKPNQKRLSLSGELRKSSGNFELSSNSNSAPPSLNNSANININENYDTVKNVSQSPSNNNSNTNLNNSTQNVNNFQCPYWIAPEILLNQEYDEKVDVYSFGMLMYELLTRQAPWKQIKNMDEFMEVVCVNKERPKLTEIPTNLKNLVESCWNENPKVRPSFSFIVNIFDNLIVDSLVEDTLGQKIWKAKFPGQNSVEWKEFIVGFYSYFNYSLPRGNFDNHKVKSLHAVIVDSDEAVTLENYAKMFQWFGPMKGIDIIDEVHNLHSKSYFHGQLSSIQSEDLLSEKAKGTYLVRFSTSNPGSFAISVNNEGSTKHYKVWHESGKCYSLGKDQFPDLEQLIKEKAESLNLRFPCPKGEKYSDSNFWQLETLEPIEGNANPTKTVVSLKKLCFRFLYKNSHLFPSLMNIPLDLLEEYHSTIIDSITSDDAGRLLWKQNLLGKVYLFFVYPTHSEGFCNLESILGNFVEISE